MYTMQCKCVRDTSMVEINRVLVVQKPQCRRQSAHFIFIMATTSRMSWNIHERWPTNLVLSFLVNPTAINENLAEKSKQSLRNQIEAVLFLFKTMKVDDVTTNQKIDL